MRCEWAEFLILGEAEYYPKITKVIKRLPEAFEKYKAIESDEKTVAQVEDERAVFPEGDLKVRILLKYALKYIPSIISRDD
ncbi:hypothetical protein OESDEN_05719 [Oesophagostomum dentatum]|uniref:Uncharacterized protein n=1 Tax=Oesophagostomum dentatum TaxID=61180 RepID=A0A0B1TE07_OESDE|nr:hypothetical protein OESDEN_05719 [Oesophagostomum dentatum]